MWLTKITSSPRKKVQVCVISILKSVGVKVTLVGGGRGIFFIGRYSDQIKRSSH